MESPGNPSFKVVRIATDDDLWVAQTDQASLPTILADPVDWVSNNIQVEGEAGVLWQPFVVVFQQIASQGADPTVLVQGINETALLTVQFSDNLGQPEPTELFPPGTTHAILQEGANFFSHLQLTGFTPTQVANNIFIAATIPASFFEALNQLPQTVNGVAPTPPLNFYPNPTNPVQYLYQGWTPLNDEPAAPDDDEPVSCEILLGDADADGNVIVNNVIVKAYSPAPDGP